MGHSHDDSISSGGDGRHRRGDGRPGGTERDTQTIAMPTFGTVTSTSTTRRLRRSCYFYTATAAGNLGGLHGATPSARGRWWSAIDIRPFMKSLESSKGCAYPAGALEELSRAVQLRLRLPH